MNTMDDFELNFAKLFRALWKKMPIILLVFVLTLVAAYFSSRKPVETTYIGKASFLVPKEYTLTERQVEYSEGQTKTGETEKKAVLFSSSIESYCLLASAPTTLETVVSRANLPCSASDLAKMLSVKTDDDDAYVISVQIESADKDDALHFAKAFASVFPDIVDKIAPEIPLHVLDSGSVRMQTSGGADIKKALLFSAAAAFVVACFVALLYVVNEYTGKNRVLSSDLQRLYPNKKILETISSTDDEKALKRLRANLLLALPERDDCRTVGLTSICSDPAKDDLSLSLAGSLAEIGDHVLLIDADLRSHRLQDLAKLQPGIGLSELIRGGKADTSALQVVAKDDVSFSILPAGDGASVASELLDCKKILPILSGLKSDHDYILLNLESFESSVDASSVGKNLDGVIVVFREEACTRNQLMACISQLEYAANTILGFVVLKKKNRFSLKR